MNIMKKEVDNLEDFLKYVRKKIVAYVEKKEIASNNRYERNMAAIEWIEKFYRHEYNKFLKYKNI